MYILLIVLAYSPKETTRLIRFTDEDNNTSLLFTQYIPMPIINSHCHHLGRKMSCFICIYIWKAHTILSILRFNSLQQHIIFRASSHQTMGCNSKRIEEEVSNSQNKWIRGNPQCQPHWAHVSQGEESSSGKYERGTLQTMRSLSTSGGRSSGGGRGLCEIWKFCFLISHKLCVWSCLVNIFPRHYKPVKHVFAISILFVVLTTTCDTSKIVIHW